MGMGDKKQTFAPPYAPILCNVTNKMFVPCAIQQCHEPHVIAKYGVGGVCNVSVYVCRKCKYKLTVQNCGAIRCGYGMEQSVQT